MKHLLFALLCVAVLPIKAQTSTSGLVRLSNSEMVDSLHRIESQMQTIQDKINRMSGVANSKSVDSLYICKWELNNKRIQLIQAHENDLGLDYHLTSASNFVRKAYTLELVGIATGIASGICIGYGIGDKKNSLKITGYVMGAAAIGCFIGAYTCHFKSGQKLRLAANSITYTF